MPAALLIIGAEGFVGGHLARLAASECPVHGADLPELDLRSPEQVRAVFERIQPRAVVLLAALSDIDRCEREPELAEQVNATGAGHVARECARVGAHLVFTSSAAVFDGARHGYTEDDPPTPLSVCGRTKAKAEALIAGLLHSALTVRLSLALGFGFRPGTNAPLDKLRDALCLGGPVPMPAQEYRNPLDAGTLSRILLDLALSEHAGIVHVGSIDSMSRYEMARRLAEKIGYPAS